MNKFKIILNIIIIILSIGYPFLFFFGKQQLGIEKISIIMIFVWGLRIILTPKGKSLFFSILMILFFAAAALLQSERSMYWYPVIVSTVMLLLFSTSLLSKQSFIERLARLHQPNLPPSGVSYTRKVTQIWCVFFIANIAVTVGLIFIEAWHWWALYTGIIAYILMGILFVGEWLYRHFILKIES